MHYVYFGLDNASYMLYRPVLGRRICCRGVDNRAYLREEVLDDLRVRSFIIALDDL